MSCECRVYLSLNHDNYHLCIDFSSVSFNIANFQVLPTTVLSTVSCYTFCSVARFISRTRWATRLSILSLLRCIDTEAILRSIFRAVKQQMFHCGDFPSISPIKLHSLRLYLCYIRVVWKILFHLQRYVKLNWNLITKY